MVPVGRSQLAESTGSPTHGFSWSPVSMKSNQTASHCSLTTLSHGTPPYLLWYLALAHPNCSFGQCRTGGANHLTPESLLKPPTNHVLRFVKMLYWYVLVVNITFTGKEYTRVWMLINSSLAMKWGEVCWKRVANAAKGLILVYIA